MIKKLHEFVDSKTDVVSFQWQGMIISLAATWVSADKRSLLVRLENAFDAGPTMGKSGGTYITKWAGVVPKGAGATITLSGLARIATELRTSK